MKVTITEAKQIASDALQALGYTSTEATTITEHLVDSEMRGYGSAGLARILSIADRLGGNKPAAGTEITREGPTSAQLDGKDTLGYLVALEATNLAIKKATEMGIAVIGANNTWYTGMLSFYAEMATANDLVVLIASNASPWVAPFGGYEPRFGTNPICIAFPSNSTPVIWDIGTSPMIHAQAVMAQRLGKDIGPNLAYNKNGEMTTNPQEALEGAFAVWGGHKGSGLAICVQLLGALAGSPASPPNLAEFGFLVIAIKPDLFRPIEEFKEQVDGYAKSLRSSKPLPGQSPLRMPFERSADDRAKALSRGYIELDETVVSSLKNLVI
jgi:LDH2 family malate/lactate/ureidoglycolate dehydrogenase